MTDDYSTGAPAPAEGSPGIRPRGARARLGWLAVAVAGALLTGRLGLWQLDRAHQKERAAALVAERARQPPLPAAALAADEAAAAAQWQRRIALDGRWIAGRTVFLMNRTMDGRAGFYVMTPLRLPDGGAVVVQRGWVARDDARTTQPPAVASPAGPVRVQGHVAPWPSHWIELGQPASGPVRQNLARAPFAAETGLALRPVTVVEDESPGAADGLRRDWPAPDIGTLTNYGYAAQWFAMAAGCLGLWAWTQLLRRAPSRDRRIEDDDFPSPTDV
jgi:surfeit locus 1 family protein